MAMSLSWPLPILYLLTKSLVLVLPEGRRNRLLAAATDVTIAVVLFLSYRLSPTTSALYVAACILDAASSVLLWQTTEGAGRREFE